jgi:ParB family chromosome partitioning protein
VKDFDLKKSALPKRGLGRGLGALLPTASSAGQGLLRHCPLEHISPDPEQPRKRFTDTHLEELSRSIREHGVIQPLLVRKTETPGHYILVAGERRLRAAGMAGLKEVPVIVMELDDRRGLEISLIENLQRADLNPIEEAEGYRRLVEEFSLSHTAVAELLGKERSTVTNTIRLLNLGAKARAALIEETISMGHGRALLGLTEEKLQEQALAETLDRGLSVRELEKWVRELKKGQPAAGETVEEEAADEAEPERCQADEDRCRRLEELYFTRTRIKRLKSGRGRIELEFRSEAELERILEALAREAD